MRNVGYDTVEALAEGPRQKVERLIEVMEQGPRGSRVDETRVVWEPVTGEFEVFGVRRSL